MALAAGIARVLLKLVHDAMGLLAEEPGSVALACQCMRMGSDVQAVGSCIPVALDVKLAGRPEKVLFCSTVYCSVSLLQLILI